MVNDPARHRLLELADRSGASLSALSRLIGRNNAYLQQFVKKGSPRKLEENDRRTLARFFGVDESELGAPDGEEISYKQAKDWIAVPRLSLGASAGPGTEANSEDHVGHLGFSRDWLREMGFSPGSLAALGVTGDSMSPTLNDGDEILVNRDLGFPRDGIHVIRRDGMLYVKRLQFRAGQKVAVISDNHAYPSEDVSVRDLEVLGRVVWKAGPI